MSAECAIPFVNIAVQNKKRSKYAKNVKIFIDVLNGRNVSDIGMSAGVKNAGNYVNNILSKTYLDICARNTDLLFFRHSKNSGLPRYPYANEIIGFFNDKQNYEALVATTTRRRQVEDAVQDMSTRLQHACMSIAGEVAHATGAKYMPTLNSVREYIDLSGGERDALLSAPYFGPKAMDEITSYLDCDNEALFCVPISPVSNKLIQAVETHRRKNPVPSVAEKRAAEATPPTRKPPIEDLSLDMLFDTLKIDT